MLLHRLLALAALAVVTLLAGLRLGRPAAGTSRGCAHPVAVVWRGRTSALCGPRAVHRLPDLARRLGVSGCRDRPVREGVLLRLSDSCAFTVEAMPATMRLTLGLPLDINRATVDDLRALPHIGPVLAARIVEHRQHRGPFPDVASLRQVRGIGPRTIHRLGGLVTAVYRPGGAGSRQALSK